MTESKTYQYGGLNLPIINQKDEKVPLEAERIKLSLSDERAIAIGISKNLPILLIGETGTGKTSVVKYLAFKGKQGYVRVSMTGYTTPDELIGSKSVKDGATYYEDGIVTNAMKNGYILVLDEINATPPDCSFILHGLLDDDKRITLPNGEIIKPHKDFRVIATMNPDYEGTKSLNRALLDRFNIVLTIDCMSPKSEQALLVKRTGIDKDIAEKLVTVATMLRKSYIEQKTLTYVSTRTLLQWAGLIGEGLEPKQAFIQSIANKTSKADSIPFMDVFNAVFRLSEKEDDKEQPVVTTKGRIRSYESELEKYRLAIEESNNELYRLKRTIEDLKSLEDEKARIDSIKDENQRLKHNNEVLNQKIATLSQVFST